MPGLLRLSILGIGTVSQPGFLLASVGSWSADKPHLGSLFLCILMALCDVKVNVPVRFEENEL